MIFDEAYFNGAGYKRYYNFLHFTKRANWIKDNLSGKILEVGCAHGYLIYELDKVDVHIAGVDKSEYVGNQLVPSVASRVTIADITRVVIPDGYYDWIISWNTLDCLDNEAHAIKVAEKLNESKNQLHVLCMSGQNYKDDGYFIKDISYWRNLLPKAYLVCHECGTVYVPEGYRALSQIPLSWEKVSD